MLCLPIPDDEKENSSLNTVSMFSESVTKNSTLSVSADKDDSLTSSFVTEEAEREGGSEGGSEGGRE